MLENIERIVKVIDQTFKLINKLSNTDKKYIEELIINFQSSALISNKNKIPYALVSQNLTFPKLQYLNRIISNHNNYLTKAILNINSKNLQLILDGLLNINIEITEEIESMNFTDEHLQLYIDKELPVLRDAINKYRFVTSNCLFNLATTAKLKSNKVKLDKFKRLIEELN